MGVSAQVLSTVYLLFLTFVPISVGVALVWSTDRAGGAVVGQRAQHQLGARAR